MTAIIAAGMVAMIVLWLMGFFQLDGD
jgi:hypothetical protein